MITKIIPSLSGRPAADNIDKVMKIVESDHHVTTVIIAQKLNIAQKTIWIHFNKAASKKEIDKEKDFIPLGQRQAAYIDSTLPGDPGACLGGVHLQVRT